VRDPVAAIRISSIPKTVIVERTLEDAVVAPSIDAVRTMLSTLIKITFIHVAVAKLINA
jgi:hypothetical protein